MLTRLQCPEEVPIHRLFPCESGHGIGADWEGTVPQNSETARSNHTCDSVANWKYYFGTAPKVKMDPPSEDSRGTGILDDSHHRIRSQVMSNTGDKVKEEIHDAAEKVKDAAHNVAEKTKDAAHDVGKKVKDATHNVAEKTKDVAHDVGEKIKDAGR